MEINIPILATDLKFIRLREIVGKIASDSFNQFLAKISEQSVPEIATEIKDLIKELRQILKDNAIETPETELELYSKLIKPLTIFQLKRSL